jgi:hypothetical protein
VAGTQVINDNGAWCWFQDERALVDPATRTLVVGSVAAPEGPGGEARSGTIELTVVDLDTGASDVVVLHERLENDDHDSPALWRRRDGRWLAVYTRHKSDDLTRWRVSDGPDPRGPWGPERTFDWSPHTGGAGVTYANLRAVGGRLYCFTRAVNDDQCALVSDDDGSTWTWAGKLFTRPKVGYVNGYTRYTTRPDGPDRIDVVTTDHHPRDFDNSIYHGYLADGALRRSDGSVLDRHPCDGDAPDQAGLTTVVAAGSVHGGVPITHCWTTDVRRAADGTVAMVVTGRHDSPEVAADAFERFRPVTDHRFLYARLAPGGTWQVHHLALAGAGLLPHEQDYTGLASIDPEDLVSLVISTPIDPRDGTALAHHEIFRGRTDDGGATWAWTAVTQDSDVDNLRPILVPGDPDHRPLVWFRGQMTASQHYRCEVVLQTA